MAPESDEFGPAAVPLGYLPKPADHPQVNSINDSGSFRQLTLPADGFTGVLLVEPFLERGEVIQHGRRIDLALAGE